MTSVHMTNFIYWCERVRKRCLSPYYMTEKLIYSLLPNYIKCSDYFDKFSLLTHTDVHLYFDNFFYDKCTCSKASMLPFEQVHLHVIEKIVKVARTDEQKKLVT
jgi:hypothetical protein